jgi:sensor histidine kinase YesM
MMLQPFAENCVRHGKVGSLEYQGNILIHFALVDEDRIKCTVTDNGVGLDESKIKTTKQNTNMRSHALQIQRERINLYNQTADIKIEFSIANRTDSMKGTIVEIILPILFYENLYNNNN